MKQLWLTLGLLMACQDASAHAMLARVDEGAVAVRFSYDDETPAADAEIRLYAPDEEQARASGTTDRHGRYAFVPDKPGRWRIEANDGMGHRATIEMTIDASAVAHDVAVSGHARHLAPWVVGVSVIFGLFGIWALWARGKT